MYLLCLRNGIGVKLNKAVKATILIRCTHSHIHASVCNASAQQPFRAIKLQQESISVVCILVCVCVCACACVLLITSKRC